MIESIVFALVCDFGPSAARDLATSNEASAFAVGHLVDAQPPMVLVDNFVNFLGAEQSETTENKKAASDQLAAASRWAVFVRCRVLADVAGTVAIVAYGRACLGAAAILAAHAACWARGAAGARVGRRAEPRPLSPPLAKIIGAADAALAALATLGAFGPTRLARVCGWSFAAALAAVEVARLVADRVRERTHVGI